MRYDAIGRLLTVGAMCAASCVCADETGIRTISAGSGKLTISLGKVEPYAKYRLRFEAKNDGPFTLEKNAQVAEGFYERKRELHGLKLPGWEIRALDDKDNLVNLGFDRCGALAKIISSEWQTYAEDFYTSGAARSINLLFWPEASGLQVRNVTFERLCERNLVVNGDFQCGRYGHAGYGGSQIRFEPAGEGLVMRFEGRLFPDAIPVEPGRSYRFESAYVGKPAREPVIMLAFRDKDGKELSSRTEHVKVTSNGCSRVATAPDKARYFCYSLNDNIPGLFFRYFRVFTCE